MIKLKYVIYYLNDVRLTGIHANLCLKTNMSHTHMPHVESHDAVVLWENTYIRLAFLQFDDALNFCLPVGTVIPTSAAMLAPVFNWADYCKWTDMLPGNQYLEFAPVVVLRSNGNWTVSRFLNIKPRCTKHLLFWEVEPGCQKAIVHDSPFVRMPQIVVDHAIVKTRLERKRKLEDE